MSYDPKAIANFFLDLAWSKGECLTQMKLQKLVYFSHGWYLALVDAPLLNEQVQAWSFGPVVRSLYDEFREFGTADITRLAENVNPVVRPQSRMQFTTSIPVLDSQGADADTRELLDRIWDVYGGYSAIQLSNITHSPNSPWDRVNQQYQGNIPKFTTIPEDWIKEYFKALGNPK